MGLDGDEDFRIFTHSSVGTVLRTTHMLLEKGRYTPSEGQPVYLTHLARTLHGTQASYPDRAGRHAPRTPEGRLRRPGSNIHSIK